MKFSEDIRPKLVAQAPDVPVRQDLKLEFYFTNAFQYREQGKAFIEAGDWERGYIMLLRFCNLATGTIPKHKHYNQDKYSRDKQTLRRHLENALDILERITDKLDTKYANMTLDQYEKMRADQDAEKERKKQEEEDDKNKPKVEEKKAPSEVPAPVVDEKKSGPVPGANAKPASLTPVAVQPSAPSGPDSPNSPPPPFPGGNTNSNPPAAGAGTTAEKKDALPAYMQPPKDPKDPKDPGSTTGDSAGYPILGL
jgi:hypothetical protein